MTTFATLFKGVNSEENVRREGGWLGLLMSFLLIAFGVVSNFTSIFSKRFRISGSLAGALILPTFRSIIRSLFSIAALNIGTALRGVVIALGNVLIPGLVKRNPLHVG